MVFTRGPAIDMGAEFLVDFAEIAGLVGAALICGSQMIDKELS